MPMEQQTETALEKLAASISQLQQDVGALREKVERLEDRLDDRGRDEMERAPPYLPRR